MTDLLLAFITGLTTGGLSCLAVQGGLLATSLANQIERDLETRVSSGKSRNRRTNTPNPATHTIQPILLFLAAKIAAYTLLGLALGALGSLIQLTPLTRAVLQIGVGIFMVGSALRMFNVHPIFRYFSFEPPKFVTRAIRRTARDEVSFTTPIVLGMMTVLIPCGVTQAMMALAVGTGNALQGASLMFAFTLGTSPVFFLVSYLATRLGNKMEAGFKKFVAVVLLLVGLFSIETGLNLAGSPISVSRLARAIQSNNSPVVETLPTLSENSLVLYAENSGYSPQVLYARAGEPLQLIIESEDTRSCARAFVIPNLNYQTLLPITGQVPVEIPAQQAGTVLQFACSMGMYTGEIVFN